MDLITDFSVVPLVNRDTDMLTAIETDYHYADISSDFCSTMHPNQSSNTQQDLFSFNSAFRLNAQDCYLNNSSVISLNSDQIVPDGVEDKPRHRISDFDIRSSALTVSVFHHHVHLFCPSRPVLVAPPLRSLQAARISMQAATTEKKFQILNCNVGGSQNKADKEIQGSILESNGQVCEHCKTHSTSLWRKVSDRLMCNACALYLKLHGCNRPLHLNTGIIKRRNRLGHTNPRRQRRYKC